MKFTTHFIRTTKEIPSGIASRNAELLLRAGFIHQEMAGVYSFLPLGLTVLRHIEQVVREEMNAVQAVEISMPSLCPKKNWETTNRWEGFDVLYKLETSHGEAALCPTHEEVITPLVQSYLKSYKDFPVCLYQFQTKFRNEPRAKSGLLRCREFLMKDAYSFHTSQEDFEAYYEQMKVAYHKVYERLGLGDITPIVRASGGAFSKYSHEFQTFHPVGEDEIYIDPSGTSWNKELIDELPCAPEECEVKPAVEVGNIFPLATKFSSAFNFKFMDQDGKEKDIIMGCYGIGVSRVMGVIAEVFADEKGLVWPKNIAPAQVHLMAFGRNDATYEAAQALYTELQNAGVSVLFDDRREKKVGFGQKNSDADLIGIPTRILLSDKTLEAGEVEMSQRETEGNNRIALSAVLSTLQD